MKNKVIVPQRAGHSFEKAKEFGDVVELLTGRVSPFNLDILFNRIKKRLDTEEVKATDFLLMSGPAIVNCLVYAEWFQRFGKVELLLFHARELRYIHRTWLGGIDDRKSAGSAHRNRKTHE